MNAFAAPMLANGMIMMEVLFVWAAIAAVVTIIALVAFILALRRRTEKRPRRLAVRSLLLSIAPSIVLVGYSDPISHYGTSEAPVLLMLSLIPVALSGAAVWLTRRIPPERPQQ